MTRERIDGGSVTPAIARASLGSDMRDLLRWAPNDVAVADAVTRLIDRKLDPPRALELPDSLTPTEAQERFDQWTMAEREAASEAMLTLPHAEDWRAAAVCLELLLAADDDRADTLLASMEGAAVGAEQKSWIALCRFRRELERQGSGAEPSDEARIEPLLEPVRQRCKPADLAEALRIGASSYIAELNTPGTHWLVSCASGRRIANLTIALARRPSLADAMEPAIAWLNEAEDLAGARAMGGVAGLIAAAEEADRSARYDVGTERMLRALARSGEQPEVMAALAARAEVLMDPDLATPSHAEGSERQGVRPAASTVELPPLLASIPLPEVPPTDWQRELERLAHNDAVASWADASLLEAAGAKQRAADSYLALGSPDALLQAYRLSEHLDGDGRERLIEALATMTSNDEFELAQATETWNLTYAWMLLSEADPFWWKVRLKASRSDADAITPTAPGVEASSNDEDGGTVADVHGQDNTDDPHSTVNRLAAAADLVSAGHLDAASTVVSALFKHLDTASQRQQLVSISKEILRDESPPPSFVGAIERLISAPGEDRRRRATAAAMTRALIGSATMAYPLHASLHRAACEAEGLSDLERVQLLQAWLGIWKATATPPAVDAVRKLARHIPLLLALAAFRIADAPDPVSSAVDFCARYPARTTSATALADALLTATAS